jgi:tetratricopeptide (TPR) repeat protein
LKYEPASNKQSNHPKPAQPALQPEEIISCEQLFLTGQHLEQYRHATYNPILYYEEALKRDATDIRNNNALGLWYLRYGQFAKSEPYFREAIKTITQRNPNPYDSEPYYNLGLSLKYQNKTDEAYDAFYKAAWSLTWKDIAYLSVAQIDMLRGNYALALEHTSFTIDNNANSGKAYVLKAAAARKLNLLNEAKAACEAGLQRNIFNLGLLFELSLTDKIHAGDYLHQLKKIARNAAQNFIEYALDYADAGLFEEANELIKIALENSSYPMLYYYQAWFYEQLNEKDKMLKCLQQAASANFYLCFPDRLQDINVLQFAIENNSSDSMAPYYLGNLFYAKRQYNEAIKYWELSESRGAGFATVYRNLGIACFNKKKDVQKALAYYEKAFSMDKNDARMLMELDNLYKRLNYSLEKRLSFLEQNLSVVNERDDIYLEKLSLYNFKGEHAKALQLLNSRQFHPWEGGEGKVSGQYLYALIQSARKNIEDKNFNTAIELLNTAKAASYPHNLGEGKLYGAQENDIFYWLGIAYEGKGSPDEAKENFKKASVGLNELSAAVYYNDQQPDKFFYQALAWKKLENVDKAHSMFSKLIQYSDEHFNDEIKIDYFAVSLPDLLIFDAGLNERNKAHYLYLKGLGYLGIEKFSEAKACFQKVLLIDNNHFGAKGQLDFLD